MKRLPLFENKLQPIQEIAGLDQDQSCNRCALHQYTPAGQRCLSAEGEPGGILVISDYPGEFERKLGRPMAGPAGRWLRELLERVAPGEKVVYMNALGCKPYEGFEDFDEAVTACRPYVAKIIEECKPRLILLMGGYAGLSVLGRTYQPLSVRKGYAWLATEGYSTSEGAGWNLVPAFLMPNPAAAVRNRLIARAFEEDLKWALSQAQGGLDCDLTTNFLEVTNPEESEEICAEFLSENSEANLAALDVEGSGMMFEPDYRIECLAIANGEKTVVWGRKALEDPEIAIPLIAFLEAGYFTSWNGLYDFCAIFNEPTLRKHNDGTPVRMRLWSDARLKRKLYEADAKADLGTAADLVGMGGHKREAHALLKEVCNELNKLALSRELTPKGKVRKRPELKYVKEAQVPEVWFEYLKHFDTEKFAYRFMDTQIMHRYCARDAHSTWRLEQWAEHRMSEVKDCNLGMVWREITQPAMWAYCEMTLNGIPLNKAKLTLFSQWLDQEMTKLKRELQIEVGIDDWNPKSDPQLREEMGKRNLKTKRKTDGGKTGNRLMKVDKESLEEFEDDPFIKKVLRYRLLHHTQSNFAAGLIPFIRTDGRVHPTYLLDGTGCLPAGELVLTSRGYIPAEDVRVGDSVISHTGATRKVVRTQVNPPSQIYRVGLSNGTVIRTTADHKFYDGENWIRADELCVGANVKVHSVFSEAWAPIEGWPYEVSTWGRVRHIKTKTIRKLIQKNKWGHLKVTLERNGTRVRGEDRKDFSVHRLVLTAHGRRSMANEEVRHLNGIAWDNTIENLAWGTTLENKHDASVHGSMSKRDSSHPQSKLTTDAVARIRSFERPRRGGRLKQTSAVSDAALAAEYGVTRELIRDVRTGLRWLPENHIGKKAEFRDAKVICVTREAEEVTYGAEVETDHSHVTGGVVTHNTGRASSSEPNMFNQLKGRNDQSAELGKMLRNCYEAPPGWVILEHDQGQIEVRMAAFLSQDKNLIEPLKDPNADFHMVNARAFARAQGKDPNAVTKMDRDNAKTSVFAAFYEIPCELPFLLSVRLDVDRSVGEDLTRAMHTSFPDMLKWMHRCYEESWQRGYSITHWKGKPARRRPLWELAKNPPTLKELEDGLIAEKRTRRGSGEAPKSKYDTTSARATYNGDNQGSAVDVITSALWPVHCWLKANTNGGQLFLTIYDSIMTMVREEDKQKTHEAVTRIMTDPSRLEVPMVVDGKWGPCWGGLEKVK